MGRLDGKVALVTGAARGIGEATARRFVAEGADVVLADRRDELGRSVADELGARYVSLDITSEDAWAGVVGAIGRVDVLVNNAGVMRIAPLLETDLDTFRKVLDTNLVGAFLGTKAVAAGMRDRGGGSIINFSSPQGIEGRHGMVAYTSSKFAVRGLTRTAAMELGPLGIRVNAVIPGPTRTAMTERPGWTDDDYAAAYAGFPLGRMGSPDEIAAVCVFLASDESSFCTGADFTADGGVLAGKPLT
jgi:3alpha(or 20beta)-hydroxysteroid dehydrogenase